MKKLILLLLFIPFVSFGQLCEKKVLFGTKLICLPKVDNMTEGYSNSLIKNYTDSFKFNETEKIFGIYLSNTVYENFDYYMIAGFDDYFKIYSNEMFESLKVNEQYLDKFASSVDGLFEDGMGNLIDDIEKKLNKQSSSDLEFSKPLVVEKYNPNRKIRTWVTLSNLVKNTSNKVEKTKMIMVMNIAVIKDRFIYFAYYKKYDGLESLIKSKNRNDSFGLMLINNNKDVSKPLEPKINENNKNLGQLGDYYYSNGHPKSKGLNFQIKKPLGFEQSEGDRPNIVQKWHTNKSDNNKMVSFMILVQTNEELKDISTEEWNQYLKYEGGVKDIASALPNSSNYKFFVVDNYPGVISDAEMTIQRLDLELTLYLTQITIFVDSYGFSLQLQSPVKRIRDENKGLLYKLANSIIFPDQYK